jgi:hypothetical protein
MDPRRSPLGARGAGKVRAETPERVLNGPVGKGSAPIGDEERNGCREGMAAIPEACVGLQGLHSRGMQRDQPRFVELRLANHQHPLALVDVVTG